MVLSSQLGIAFQALIRMWYIVARLRLVGRPETARLQLATVSQHHRPSPRPRELSAEMRLGEATVCFQVAGALLEREAGLEVPACESTWLAVAPGGGAWELRGELLSRTLDGEYDHGVDYADGRTLCMVALSGPRVIYRLTVLARERDRVPFATSGVAAST